MYSYLLFVFLQSKFEKKNSIFDRLIYRKYNEVSFDKKNHLVMEHSIFTPCLKNFRLTLNTILLYHCLIRTKPFSLSN